MNSISAATNSMDQRASSWIQQGIYMHWARLFDCFFESFLQVQPLSLGIRCWLPTVRGSRRRHGERGTHAVGSRQDYWRLRVCSLSYVFVSPLTSLCSASGSLVLRNNLHTGPIRGLDFNPIQTSLLSSGAVNGEVGAHLISSSFPANRLQIGVHLGSERPRQALLPHSGFTQYKIGRDHVRFLEPASAVCACRR
jgi:hypothetical protein